MTYVQPISIWRTTTSPKLRFVFNGNAAPSRSIQLRAGPPTKASGVLYACLDAVKQMKVHRTAVTEQLQNRGLHGGMAVEIDRTAAPS